MAETTYTYSIADDFPDGAVNTAKLATEIAASAITIALARVDTVDDDCNIVFRDALSAGDQTVLDGDTTGPAGGLIAAHDNTPNEPDEQPVKFTSPQFIWSKPTSVGVRGMLFSQDFTDKTTWFNESVAVTAEAVGTGDGSTVVFNLANPWVIDLSHGLISDENYITKSGGGSYIPVVKVDGVVKTEREYGFASGGDYEINYATGAITFFVAPPNGEDITCDYNYSPIDAGSHFIAGPPADKVLTITAFEMNVSADMGFTDTIITAAYIWPQALGLPAGPKMEVPGSRQYFKNMDDVINYTQRSWPPFPPISGPNGREMTQERYQLRFEYSDTSVMTLNDAYGLELHMWLEHHVPFTGEKACVTFEGFVE